ncbi:MAG: arylesterase [Thermodesulfobacteriota bacterium]|nr:arylesterase [Thermodesulfobacteriota bacterium]
MKLSVKLMDVQIRWLLMLVVPFLWLFIAACGGPELSTLPEDGVIVAFGDSLTRGTGVSPENSYPAVLAGMTGMKVINAGVPGEVTAEGLDRLPGVMDRYRPDLVIICHGGNDILQKQSMADAGANLDAMVRMVLNRNIDVVLVAVPKLSIFGSPPDFYEQVARRHKVPIDMDTLGDLERDRSMKSDPIHLNAAGYRELAGTVYQMLGKYGAIP